MRPPWKGPILRHFSAEYRSVLGGCGAAARVGSGTLLAKASVRRAQSQVNLESIPAQ
jgi:hypothetical protein